MLTYREWFESQNLKIKKDYFDFLQFRTISADPTCKEEIIRCAEWLKDYLKRYGFSAELISTSGYPLVYAEDLSAGKSKPTLMIYGHYDVQPVDPIELWKSDPFTPTERDGYVYARGALDDKGQIFYAILAAIAVKQLHGHLPINLKFCIEGEEETSSAGLQEAIPKIREKMAADYLLVPDFDMYSPDTPAISLGCRGLCALEIILRGSHGDLHSGMYGGIAYNPNRALVELLSHVWDSEGRIQIPGFYEDVQELDEKGKKRYDHPTDRHRYTKEAGIEAFGGEKGLSLQEVNVLRPTFEINGLCGGYSGVGVKTVIPAEARAKITCRLVPNQDPNKIVRQITKFLQARTVFGMKVEIEIKKGGSPAFRTSPDSKLARAVMLAAEEVCGKPCKKTLSGGSIPVIPELIAATDAEMVGMGYGLGDDEIHAPNERFDWSRFEKGFLTVARTVGLLG